MREYSREMNMKALEAKEQAMREAQAAAMAGQSTSPNAMNNSSPDMTSTDSTSQGGRRTDPAAGGADDEEGKRNLITSEIQMFRDRFKDEETKMRNTEKERKERYERERVLQREKRIADESAKNKSPTSPSRDRSPSRRDHGSSSSSNRRDRNSPNDDRYRGSLSRSHASNSVRSRANDRRNSPPSRYDRRSPVPSASRPYNRRSRTKSPVSKSHGTNEDDDEAYERKRQERRLRDKEYHYREVD